jgi:AcrR family transcriptional regulator
LSAPGAVRRAPRSRLSAAERRGQILDAAEQLFSDGPYEEVSLEQIAERAGITRGLINHHFGTRRELYIEVVRRRLEVPVLPIPEYVQGATVRERLDESIGGWLDEVERGRETWLAAVGAAEIGDPEIAAIVEASREQGAVRAAEVMGFGPAAELSPERLGMLRAWLALAEAAIVQWLEHRRLTREQVQLLAVETGARAAEGMIDELAALIGEQGGAARD